MSKGLSRIHDFGLAAGLAAAMLAVAPPAALAQQRQQPNLTDEEQISPRQVQTVPAARPRPPAARAVQPNATSAAAQSGAEAATTAAPETAEKHPAKHGTDTIACGGVFAKDSSHVKLAQFFQANNIEYGQVTGGGGSALNATILFAKEPKRRLEVLWQNDAARSDISLIVITGKSQWKGPKGLHLGLTLAALEKLNGKPFRLSGFDQADGSSALDWQGGALSALPGGCQVGVRFAPDSKAAPTVLAAAGGKDLMSNAPALRAAKPVVSEIIFGYSQ